MNTNNKSNDEWQQYGCYPFFITKFAINETELGWGVNKIKDKCKEKKTKVTIVIQPH